VTNRDKLIYLNFSRSAKSFAQVTPRARHLSNAATISNDTLFARDRRPASRSNFRIVLIGISIMRKRLSKIVTFFTFFIWLLQRMESYLINKYVELLSWYWYIREAYYFDRVVVRVASVYLSSILHVLFLEVDFPFPILSSYLCTALIKPWFSTGLIERRTMKERAAEKNSVLIDARFETELDWSDWTWTSWTAVRLTARYFVLPREAHAHKREIGERGTAELDRNKQSNCVRERKWLHWTEMK